MRPAPLLLCLAAAVACGGKPSEPIGFDKPDLTDQPLPGLDETQLNTFIDGDGLFDLALRGGDGLGPLYTHTSCGQCHDAASRGPGLVQKFSVVMADGVTPSPDQSRLAFGHTEHPLYTAGATTPILAPKNDPEVRISVRVGPPVLGRGYLEALADETLVELEREQATRTDGISGRVNRVTYQSEPQPGSGFNPYAKGQAVLGRFGLKARISTLDEFTADAMQGDMGITSPLRPTELRNPDGLTDDLKPGIDVTLTSVEQRAAYIRMIEIPRRQTTAEGAAVFALAHCDGCHAVGLKTRADYPLTQLAGVDAPVYTDLLLHDMGVGLADGLQGEDGAAGPREWRTAPLIGLRFSKFYLHDSRADSAEAAIEAHASEGSEANDSVSRFRALSAADRQLLLSFVEAL